MIPLTSLPRSLQMTAPLRSGRRVAAVIVLLLTTVSCCLIFVPWQQTVIGYGQVAIYSAMDRPQNVEAQIPGRLVEWKVQEGQTVRQGDVLAHLEDIDSKFLDTEQPLRLAEQRQALERQKARAEERTARLKDQYDSLTDSRRVAVATARQRVEQARQRRVAAAQALVAAQKGVRIADEVSRQAASERARQAADRVKSAEQALEAAQQNLETSRLNRERIAELYGKGLRSKRDEELAENDLVKNRTEVRRAELARDVAVRDASVGNLDQSRANIEVERVQTDVERARAALDIADRDIATASLDLNKLLADTAASLSSVEASLESARESIAKIDADLVKLSVDQRNTERRVSQQEVKAPRDGRIVRLLKVGAGETVKAGDILAVVAPETNDRAVELMVYDNDIPLVSEGRQVRLQFAGWPAVQFSGFPSIAVGTFAGRVSVIDAVDDSTGRYRVIVRPDEDAIRAGKEQAWPKPSILRPGAKTTGWILLDTVPLGFELWRQFNAFPPTVRHRPGEKESAKDDKSSSGSSQEEKGGKESSPFIKIKQVK